MSWSISCIGKPASVVAAIDEHAAGLSGQCKLEFDAAAPHLKGLVVENFTNAGSGAVLPLIELTASGSGYAGNTVPDGPPVQLSRSCQVSIKPLWTKLV